MDNQVTIIDNNDLVKDKIATGIVALESALFDQCSYEAKHLNKLRELAEKLENRVFALINPESEDIDHIYTAFNAVTKYMQMSIGFLERMHKLSADTAALMQVTQRLNNSIDSIPQEKMRNVDSAKIKDIQRKLIAIMSRQEQPIPKRNANKK